MIPLAAVPHETFACRTFTPPDFAVDLGTATLRVWSTESELVEVSSRIGTDDVSARYPLRGGVVVDCDGAAHLLGAVFRRLRTWHARPPRVLATVPGDASDEERMALLAALHRAGAGTVVLIPEPVAAAVGAGLEDAGSVRMLVDVGEGVTEVALLSRGVLLHRASIRLACADMRDCIRRAAANDALRLSRQDADAILAGDDSGPHHAAADAAILTIAAFVTHLYRDLDARIRQRVARAGICLTGGGALVERLRNALEGRLEIPVSIPADPLRSVIAGARRLLDGEAAHVWAGFADD